MIRHVTFGYLIHDELLLLQHTAKLALQTLCTLWVANPSVCPSVRLSVTLRYYAKGGNTERYSFWLFATGYHKQCLWFSDAKNILWGTTLSRLQIKVEYKEVDPRENSRAVHISPYNYGTVIDSQS